MRVVLLQATPEAKFNATYRYYTSNENLEYIYMPLVQHGTKHHTSIAISLCILFLSGPDTLFENDFVKTSIPGQPGWLLHAYASTPEAWSKWFWTYSNPDEALKLWMEENPEPWVKARRETLGKNWVDKVFTGTHERIEDHQV